MKPCLCSLVSILIAGSIALLAACQSANQSKACDVYRAGRPYIDAMVQAADRYCQVQGDKVQATNVQIDCLALSARIAPVGSVTITHDGGTP